MNSTLQRRIERAKRYFAAPGATFTDSDAQVIGEELERIEASGTPITPENVVAIASSASNPLHRFFTWDDTIAADNWRKHEARSLVSHLVVRIEGQDEPIEVRARISVVASVPSEGAALPQYVPTSQVLDTPALRQQLLEQARRELKSWADKYERLGLNELSPVFRSVETWVK